MKCLYKDAIELKRKTEVCDHLGNKWLTFIEALTASELHRIYGWGAGRIREMQGGVDELLNELMSKYAADGEDIWETTLTANYGLSSRLKSIGFDITAVEQRLPVVDRFGESWHSERDRQKHIFRAQWIATMEKKLTVYFAVLFLWLNERHGFGAVRLERLYVAMRIKYNQFAGLFLLCKPGLDRVMSLMIEDEKEKAKAIMREANLDKPLVSVDGFLKKINTQQQVSLRCDA